MKTNVGWLFLFALFFTILTPIHGQDPDLVTQIDDYCNQVDQTPACETTSLSGESVSLDYFKCNGKTVLITEQALGYRYLHINTRYYLKEGAPVRVNADIEITTYDGNSLTVELHRIWFSGKEAVLYKVSEQSFDPDSLYYESPDPVATAERVRKEARFQQKNPDPELMQRILKNISLYLLHDSLKQDTLPDNLSSPFI